MENKKAKNIDFWEKVLSEPPESYKSWFKDEKKLPFDYGALVSKGTDGEAAVVSGSPADNAGIKEGDIILEFGSKLVNKEHQLAPLIVLYSVGDSISLKVWRDGKTITLQVILAEKP